MFSPREEEPRISESRESMQIRKVQEEYIDEAFAIDELIKMPNDTRLAVSILMGQLFPSTQDISHPDRYFLQKAIRKGIPKSLMGEFFQIFAFLADKYIAGRVKFPETETSFPRKFGEPKRPAQKTDVYTRTRLVEELRKIMPFLNEQYGQKIATIGDLNEIGNVMTYFGTNNLEQVKQFINQFPDRAEDIFKEINWEDYARGYIYSFPIAEVATEREIEEFRQDLKSGHINMLNKKYGLQIPDIILWEEMAGQGIPEMAGQGIPEMAGQGFTNEMFDDQNQINETNTRMNQTNYFKENLLELNQNPILNTEPLKYITQAQDLATAQRRRAEENKYQINEFDRVDEISQIMNEQQYLTMQTYSNMKYGIPSYQSNDITRSKEFFHK